MSHPWSSRGSLYFDSSDGSKSELNLEHCRQQWNLKPSVGSWIRPPTPASITYKAKRAGIDLQYRVPPWHWCVDEKGFDDFMECVRKAHSCGMIPNDPDPSTGSVNPFHDDPDVGPNMHTVNKHVIIPRTRSMGGMSWALMQQREGLPISFFVTHSWKEGAYEFYRKVKHSWPAGMHMWCCFLANPQSWEYQDLKGLLGQRDDLADSPFMQALSSATLRRFLVVPNCVESLYRRLWCVAELKKAMEIELSQGAPFIIVAKDPLWAAQKQHNNRKPDPIAVMLSEAACTDKADEKRIRAYIGGHEKQIENMINQIAKGRKSAQKTDKPFTKNKFSSSEHVRMAPTAQKSNALSFERKSASSKLSQPRATTSNITPPPPATPNITQLPTPTPNIAPPSSPRPTSEIVKPPAPAPPPAPTPTPNTTPPPAPAASKIRTPAATTNTTQPSAISKIIQPATSPKIMRQLPASSDSEGSQHSLARERSADRLSRSAQSLEESIELKSSRRLKKESVSSVFNSGIAWARRSLRNISLSKRKKAVEESTEERSGGGEEQENMEGEGRDELSQAQLRRQASPARSYRLDQLDDSSDAHVPVKGKGKGKGKAIFQAPDDSSNFELSPRCFRMPLMPSSVPPPGAPPSATPPLSAMCDTCEDEGEEERADRKLSSASLIRRRFSPSSSMREKAVSETDGDSDADMEEEEKEDQEKEADEADRKSLCSASSIREEVFSERDGESDSGMSEEDIDLMYI